MNKKTVRRCARMVALDGESAEFRAYIGSKGRLVIPKEVMDALGIEESSLLTCRIRKVPLAVRENSRKRGIEMRRQFAERKIEGNISAQLYVAEKTGMLNDLLFNAVDETLKKVFMEEGAKFVYDYLENDCHIRPEEIAKKPKVFFTCLKKLLGSGVAELEILVLKNLYNKLGLKIEKKKGYQFSEFTRELEGKLLSSKHEGVQNTGEGSSM